MLEYIKTIEETLSKLKSDMFYAELETAKKELEKDLEITRLTRGIESIKEAIKTKEDIIDDLRESVKFYLPSNQKQNQKGGEEKK